MGLSKQRWVNKNTGKRLFKVTFPAYVLTTEEIVWLWIVSVGQSTKGWKKVLNPRSKNEIVKTVIEELQFVGTSRLMLANWADHGATPDNDSVGWDYIEKVTDISRPDDYGEEIPVDELTALVTERLIQKWPELAEGV